MANSRFILKLDSSIPHADFANQIGGVLVSYGPTTYYRVKVLHDDVLEVSRLARRPKQMKTEPAPVKIETIFDTLDEAAASAEPKTTEPKAAEPKTTEPMNEDRVAAIRTHANRYISRMKFGRLGRGRKTAYIIILLTLGLDPKQVVAMMQALGFTAYTSTGTVMQRRRGLRTGGWECDFCQKHGIRVNLADIV